MSTYALPTLVDDHEHGTCPNCGQRVVLTRDGTLARHNLPGKWRRGAPPDEETATLMDALNSTTVQVPTKCSWSGQRPQMV